MSEQSKNNFEKIVNFGSINYISFNEAIIVKICSKYLNNSLILPHNAVFTIIQTKDIDNIKPTLLKYGSYVERINLSHVVSIKQNIDLICDLCRNLHILELTYVEITSKWSIVKNINQTDKVLTEEYLNSKHFKKLQKLIVSDSVVHVVLLENQNIIIEKKISKGLFWHEYAKTGLCVCHICNPSWSRHLHILDVVWPKSKLPQIIVRAKQYTSSALEASQNKKIHYPESNHKKIHYPVTNHKKIHHSERIHKKYQILKPTKIYARKIQKHNYCRRLKN